jgi:magnesium transporter
LPVYLGTEAKPVDSRIVLCKYNVEDFQKTQLSHWQDIEDYLPKDSENVWINVCGLNAPQLIQQIGTFFQIHPLVIEDLSNTYQRSKLENYERYLFFASRILYIDEDHQIINSPLFFILQNKVLITFHETNYPSFANIYKRLQNPESRMRSSSVDYLAYALLDEMVDEYFSIVENLSNSVEVLEEKLLSDNSPKTLHEISDLKKQLISLKRTVWPMRQLIHALTVIEVPMIQASTKLYFRDIYDHTIQIVEALETFRELLSSMLDIYLSGVNNHTNEVMKVLTMIATVFMPLAFITGIYGMNFHYMPELQLKYAYPGVWILSLLIMIGMFFYFKKKKWL